MRNKDIAVFISKDLDALQNSLDAVRCHISELTIGQPEKDITQTVAMLIDVNRFSVFRQLKELYPDIADRYIFTAIKDYCRDCIEHIEMIKEKKLGRLD